MHLWPSCIPLLSWQLQVLPPSASCLCHTSSPGSMQWFKEGRYTIMIRAATCKLGFARTVETRRGREGYPIAAVPPLTCRPLTPQLISRLVFISAQLTAWVVPSTGEGHKFDGTEWLSGNVASDFCFYCHHAEACFWWNMRSYKKRQFVFMREEFKSVIRGADAGRYKQQMVNNMTRIMGR